MTFGLWSAVPPTLPPSACADALPGRDAAGGNICRDQPAPSVATQAACCAACDASVNCEVWRFDPAPTAAQPCTLLFGVSSTVAAKDPGTVIGGSGVAPPPAPPAGESSTVWTALGYAADVYLSPLAGELILCTVTFRPNRAHNWTCSPSYIFGREGGSRRCAPSAYFSLLSLGYAAGLSLAFIANALGWTIAGVRGQPALLYLVPCTLLPLVLAAALRGDLCTMWRGTHLAPHAKAGGEGDGVHAEGERAGGEMQERTALADERDAEIGASDPRSE